MNTTQITGVRSARVTSRCSGLAIKARTGKSISSIRPKREHQTRISTAMNPGETVIYQQKPCVVLDAIHEGYPGLEGHVLLEELTQYTTNIGRVRHLAQLDDLDKGSNEALPGSSFA